MADPQDVARFVLSYENLKAWCDRQKYEYRANDEVGQLAINYALLGQPSPLMILPHLSRGMVMLAMRQPYSVPADRRAAILEATSLLNSTSLMGAWTANRETGEIFFRVTVVALDIGYTDQGLLHVARVVVGTSEKAAPALRAVALDGAEPSKAISALVMPS